MFTRSELRHACYREKNGAATEENKKLLLHIEPLLSITQNFKNFSVDWDLLVNQNDEIIIIKPETDYDFIHSTCLEAKIFHKNNLENNFDDRKQNIINIIEILMLDSIMSWDNYTIKWGVFIDPELNQIKTILYGLPQNQLKVTEEMITNSSKHKNDDEILANQITQINEPIILNTKEMNKEEIDDFKNFMNQYNKGI